MEIIVVIVVVIVLCKVIGISNLTLILCALGLIMAVIAAMLLFFVVFCSLLLFSKRRKAKFTRFGKTEKGRFTVAFYSVDGTEYPCVFPKESVTGWNTYSVSREYNVMYCRPLKKVFDIWSILTCIVGLIFSGAASVLAVFVIIFVAGM